MKKDERLLRIGVLGCGPIAQFAHFDAIRKARNAELYAVCDAAPDLLAQMTAVHGPRVAYDSFDKMLADPQIEAVVIGVADQFHASLCRQALDAGKHVLIEKPLGVAIEECEELRDHWQKTKLVFQVGHNRRFDPGIAFAQRFIREEMGRVLGLKAWYYDSTHRYTMTDNLQPIPLASAQARRPGGDPKANKRRYFLLTHGSHLVDTVRFMGGEIAAVRARIIEAASSYCWFVSIEFANGALGHVDLAIPVRGDFEEGFHIFGEKGSVKGKVYLPWFHKSSDVECFLDAERQFRRPLGEDAHSYKRQIEGFAATILDGAPQHGATMDDGVASMRALVAIARSVESGDAVRLADVTGGV